MGDRGNVAIYDIYGDDDSAAVVLYTHWGGEGLPTTVRNALNKRWRWDDGAYLARIVFDCMTRGDHDEETGYGITANTLCDNEYPVLVLDTKIQRIAVRAEDSWQGRVGANEGLNFEQFVALTDDEAQNWAGRRWEDD